MAAELAVRASLVTVGGGPLSSSLAPFTALWFLSCFGKVCGCGATRLDYAALFVTKNAGFTLAVVAVA